MNVFAKLGVLMALPMMAACSDMSQMGLTYQPMSVEMSADTINIDNGPGGSLYRHAGDVEAARRSGKTVVLGGQYCLSACTMFLGLQNVCVQPDTIFGFHGPNLRGQRMEEREHIQWTYYVAGYYPKDIAADFIETYSHEIAGFYYFSGREINSMYGIPLCN